jgi:hypothetical protein
MQIVPARSIEKMGRPLGTAPSLECGGFSHVEDLLICSFQLRVPKLVCVVRSQCLDATGTLYSLRRIDRGLPQCRPIARHLKLAGASLCIFLEFLESAERGQTHRMSND